MPNGGYRGVPIPIVFPSCRGLELDPAYVDTAIRRWQALTGEQARHAGSGRLFDESRPELGAVA
jgi:hypothetical protein